jgi:hypothetical protein
MTPCGVPTRSEANPAPTPIDEVKFRCPFKKVTQLRGRQPIESLSIKDLNQITFSD